MNNTHSQPNEPYKDDQYDTGQHDSKQYENDQYDTAAEDIPEENNYDSSKNEGGSVFDNIMDILNDYDREHPSPD